MVTYLPLFLIFKVFKAILSIYFKIIILMIVCFSLAALRFPLSTMPSCHAALSACFLCQLQWLWLTPMHLSLALFSVPFLFHHHFKQSVLTPLLCVFVLTAFLPLRQLSWMPMHLWVTHSVDVPQWSHRFNPSSSQQFHLPSITSLMIIALLLGLILLSPSRVK
jgi:hypothetical protein